MSGSGHVLAYNRISNVGDAVHGTGHGSLSASDFYNNDINLCTDDGIETDHGEFNIRVFNNRIRNVRHGITIQPGRVGPTYIFRNVIYNAVNSPFKMNNHTTGPRIFHNTCFKHNAGLRIIPAQEWVVNLFMRNNLFLAAKGTGFYVGTRNMKHWNIDNDGYGGYDRFSTWNGKKRYKTMADAKAGGEIYSVLGAHKIDPKTCFEKGSLAPTDPDKVYAVERMDHRLAAKSDAIDKGVVMPGFNDGFKGKAPDLGALEFGDPLPLYGPRPRSESE